MTLVKFFFKGGGGMEYITPDPRPETEAKIAMWRADENAGDFTATTPNGTFLIAKAHVAMTLITDDPKPQPPQPPISPAAPASPVPAGSVPNESENDAPNGGTESDPQSTESTEGATS